jgi:hypothetical protein
MQASAEFLSASTILTPRRPAAPALFHFHVGHVIRTWWVASAGTGACASWATLASQAAAQLERVSEGGGLGGYTTLRSTLFIPTRDCVSPAGAIHSDST